MQGDNESSAMIRARVEQARRQAARFDGTESGLTAVRARALERFCRLMPEAVNILNGVYAPGNESARTC